MVKRVTADGEVVDAALSQTMQAGVDPFVLPRAPGLYDPDAVSRSTAYVETMPSLTEQSDESSSNLNTMIERLGLSEVQAQGYSGPFEADFTSAPADFRESVERVQRAQAAFARLPPRVRTFFGNDPGELLEFMERTDEEAYEQAVDLGLIKARPATGAPSVASAAAATPPGGGVAGSGQAAPAPSGAVSG